MQRITPVTPVDTEMEVDTLNIVNNLDIKTYLVAVEWSGGNPIYVGEAAPGTLKSATGWRIKKITWSGSEPTDVQWADSVDTFTKIWDDRLSYSYG